jgi:general secretion pathway protein D
MRVFFAPGQVEATQGSTVTVVLSVASGSDVAAAPMQIQYDPKVLTLNDIQRGAFLSSDGQNPTFTKNILNEQGLATVQLNRQPGGPGVTGSGQLVTLTFQAVGKGSTTVRVPNLTIRNSQGATLVTASPQLSVNIR